MDAIIPAYEKIGTLVDVDSTSEAGMCISMSRRGDSYDNAQAESFFKTLKHEEVNLTQYRNFAEAAASIGAFIEQVYNRERLHSALSDLPPVEFEHNLETARQRVLIATP